MSEQKPVFHPWFHKALIFFFLWAYALVAVIQGFLDIQFVNENGVHPAWPVIALAVGLMLVGAFTVKTRFDLAAFRPQAPKELLGVCLAAAVILAAIDLLLDSFGADSLGRRIVPAGIVALWGITLYRYYHDRPYLFEEEQS